MEKRGHNARAFLLKKNRRNVSLYKLCFLIFVFLLQSIALY